MEYLQFQPHKWEAPAGSSSSARMGAVRQMGGGQEERRTWGVAGTWQHLTGLPSLRTAPPWKYPLLLPGGSAPTPLHIWVYVCMYVCAYLSCRLLSTPRKALLIYEINNATNIYEHLLWDIRFQSCYFLHLLRQPPKVSMPIPCLQERRPTCKKNRRLVNIF